MPESSHETLRFDGQVAIVTGAGAGLGKHYALCLAERGAKILVNSLNAERAQGTVDAIRAVGGQAALVVGDVSNGQMASKIVQAAIENFGKVDILINNAGPGHISAIESATDQDFGAMVSAHLHAPWALSRAAWPHMKKQGYGRVLMVSSQVMLGATCSSVYASVKAGVYGMSRALAVEGAPLGINVNTIIPGAFTENAHKIHKNPEYLRWVEETMPAAGVANTCAWIVHKECQRTGDCFNAIGNSVTRYLMVETVGFTLKSGTLTAEFVRDHSNELYIETNNIILNDTVSSIEYFQNRIGSRPSTNINDAFTF